MDLLLDPVESIMNGLHYEHITLHMYDCIYREIHVPVLSDKVYLISKHSETIQHCGHSRFFERLGVDQETRNALEAMMYCFYYCDDARCRCRFAGQNTDAKRDTIPRIPTIVFNSGTAANASPRFYTCKNKKTVCKSAEYRTKFIDKLFNCNNHIPVNVKMFLSRFKCMATIITLVSTVFYKTYFIIIPQLVHLVSVDDQKSNHNMYNQLLGVAGQMLGLYSLYNSRGLHREFNAQTTLTVQKNMNSTIRLLAEIRLMYDQIIMTDCNVIQSLLNDDRVPQYPQLRALPIESYKLDTYLQQQNKLKQNPLNQKLYQVLAAIIYKLQPLTSTLNDILQDY